MLKQNFSIHEYLARYLGGEICLREGRHVSNKRLALFQSGAVKDELCEQITNNALSYTKALAYLINKDKLTNEVLFNLIGQLKDKKSCGEYRTTQNWIGVSKKEANYIPPPPSLVPKLMDNFLEEVNKYNFSSISFSEIFSVYCQFILIHPFRDGNGRVARIIFDYLCIKSNSFFVSPTFYRAYTSTPKYVKLIHSSKSKNFPKSLCFKEFYNWNLKASNSITEAVNNVNSVINQMLLFKVISAEAKTILENLFNTPIIDVTASNNSRAIFELQELGILTERTLRKPLGKKVFVCDLAVDLLNTIERELTKP